MLKASFTCHHPRETKITTRLQFGLSYLRKDKIRHNFYYLLSLISHCGSDVKLTLHYLLHRPMHNAKRHTLLSNIRNTEKNFLDFSKTTSTKHLIFDCKRLMQH